MFENNYLIDPGTYSLRLYDPKTHQVLSIRACRLCHAPSVIGEEALKASWGTHEHLIYPFYREKIKADPAPLLKSLFSKAPTERYLMAPNVSILSFQQPEVEQEKKWSRLLLPYRISKVRMVPAFAPSSPQPFLHIHSGASLTHFILGNHNEVLAYQAIPQGGHMIDVAISNEVTRMCKVLISTEDACALKEAASSALSEERDPVLCLTGLNQRNEYVQLKFRASDLWKSLIEPVLEEVATKAKTFLSKFSPTLQAEVLNYPVRLTGGMANCYGLFSVLESALQAEVQVPDNPETWILNALSQHPSPFFLEGEDQKNTISF